MSRKLAALTLALALILTGCGEEAVQHPAQPEDSPSPTSTATATPDPTPFTLPYYPNASLHPITGSNRSNLVLASLVYQGLFALDNTFTPRGVLCSGSSVSEDGLTWTFALTDAVFSDGTPLTASDVALSLEQARSSSLYAARLADIQTVTADEDGTVILTLSRPNGALPALLDIPVVRDRGGGSLPLGTGPYAFAEDDGTLHLSRQTGAPDTAPEKITLFPIEGADELIYAFDAGNISLVTSDLTGSNTLGYSTGYEICSYPTTTMLYVGFQTQDGPCQDPLVRQAVSRSFDRDTVTVSLLSGHGFATCLPVPPQSPLYSSALEKTGGYHSGAAVQLLTQAGYASGEDGLLAKVGSPLTLTLLVNTDNSFKLAIAEYLTGQLAELGISTELKKLAWEDYLVALAAGEFDLYLGEVTLTADFDLSPLLGKNGVLNYGGYDSPETEILLEQLRAAQGATRTTAAFALLDRFQSEVPLAPICFKSHCILTQWRVVSGLEPTRQNPFHQLEALRFGA